MAFGSATIGDYFINIVPSMDKFSSEMRSQASSGGSKFGSLFSNSFSVALGNVASDVFSNLIGSFGDVVQAGMDASDAMARFEQTMGFAGVTGAEFEAARDAAKAYADATVYNLDTILNTTAQLASNGVADYESLMEAAGNLNAIAGGNANSFDAVALALTQVNGAGRLTTQDFNQLANAIPGASGQLQQALADMGAFDSETMNFRDAMAAGEISAEEFNAAIMNLGMSDAAQEAATSTDTFEGSIGNFQAAIENLSMGVMSAFAPAITGIINGLTSLVDKAAPYLATAANAFADFIANAQSAFGNLGTVVTPYVEAFIGYLQNAWGALSTVLQSDVMQSALSGLMGAFENLASVVGPFMNDVIMPLASAVLPLLGGALGALAVTVSNSMTAIVTAITLVIGIVTAWVEGVQAAATFISETFDTIKTKVGDAMANIGQRISDGWEQAKANASAKLDALKSKVQEAWDNIKSKVTEKVDSIKEKISSGFESAKNKVTEVFNTIKEKIVNPIKEAKDKITGFIDDISSAISGVHLELPSIPLPHFSVSGGTPPYGIAGMGSMPHFSVSWYAQGGIIDKAMLFGAGEKGAELIWPSYSPYLDRYADAIASRMGGAGSTNVYIDGSIAALDARLSALLGEVVNYVIGTYAMGRA